MVDLMNFDVGSVDVDEGHSTLLWWHVFKVCDPNNPDHIDLHNYDLWMWCGIKAKLD